MVHVLLAALVLLSLRVSYLIGREKGRAQVIEKARLWEQLAEQMTVAAEYWKLAAKDREYTGPCHSDHEPDDGDAFVEICELERMYRIL